MRYSAAAVGISIRFCPLLRWEFEIIFLEILIPFPDSEDMLRLFFWQKFQNDKSKIITALLFSRVCGLMALSILLPFSVIAFYNITKPPFFNAIWLVPLVCFILPYILQWILPLLATGMRKTTFIPVTIADNITQIAAARIPFISYVSGLGLSMMQFAIIAFEFYILVHLGGLEVSYLQILAVIPLVVLSFLLPLSIQGIGLPEAAMGWLLIHFGSNPESATVVGTVHLACYLVMIMVGGLIIFISSEKRISDIKTLIQFNKNQNIPKTDMTD